MNLKLSSTYLLLLFFLNYAQINAQNLLDPFTWTVGCGNVSGFNQNGADSENCRELGENHVGDEVVLWKAIPDSANNADGGWNSSYLDILITNRNPKNQV